MRVFAGIGLCEEKMEEVAGSCSGSPPDEKDVNTSPARTFTCLQLHLIQDQLAITANIYQEFKGL